jgi:hypothetical protein
MKNNAVLGALQTGETTLRELRGITDEEMAAAVRAGQTLTERGEHLAAAEILAGLALYDPFRPDVWLALEDLFRTERQPDKAKLFSDLARAMAAA